MHIYAGASPRASALTGPRSAPMAPRVPAARRADRCSALCHLRHRLQTRLHAPTVPMPAPAGHFPVDNVDKPVENFCLRGLSCGQTWGELRALCRSPTNGPGPCRLLPWELPTYPILRRSPLRTRHTHPPKVTDQAGCHGDRSGMGTGRALNGHPGLPTCPLSGSLPATPRHTRLPKETPPWLPWGQVGPKSPPSVCRPVPPCASSYYAHGTPTCRK